MSVLWTAPAPNFPESLSPKARLACLGLIELIGKFQVSKIQYEDYNAIGYHVRFADFLTIRRDEPLDNSVAFYGPGGCGEALNDCIIKAFRQFEYFKGSVVCMPPKEVYGVVRSTRTQDLYGKPVQIIDRSDDLNFAMRYAIGVVPPNFPADSHLLPVEAFHT